MSIYCIGRNYSAHAKELGNPVPESEPVVFIKSMAALRGLDSAPVAFSGEQFHHEAELVLRIKDRVMMGQEAGWRDVSDVALGIDVTRRQVQSHLKAKGLPWTTAKSFAGSALVGPFVPCEQFSELNAITFSLHVNAILKQRGALPDMIFSIPQILTFLASLHDLVAGDLIFTGTPEGVGPLSVGDRIRLSFDDQGLSWDGVF